MPNCDESTSSLPPLPASLVLNDTEWLPLLDYAMKTGLSLSTLRRYIKANKIPHRVERGRYLLRIGDELPASIPVVDMHHGAASFSRLETDLQRAKEEIAELKTLIAFYEERMSRSNASRDT